MVCGQTRVASRLPLAQGNARCRCHSNGTACSGALHPLNNSCAPLVRTGWDRSCEGLATAQYPRVPQTHWESPARWPNWGHRPWPGLASSSDGPRPLGSSGALWIWGFKGFLLIYTGNVTGPWGPGLRTGRTLTSGPLRDANPPAPFSAALHLRPRCHRHML